MLPRFASALAVLLLLPGCRTVEPVGRSVFRFQVNGSAYEVISLSLASGEGVNYLIRRSGDQVVFRARDDEQDGHIDLVLIGNVSVAQADSLYGLGIAEARRRGQYARREPTRTYLVTRADGQYTIRSVMLASGSWYNAFTINPVPDGHEVYLLDSDADGTLDSTDLDDRTMAHWQVLYRSVLEEGVRAGRIELTLSGYLVR